MLLHSKHKNIRVKRAAEIGIGDFHTGHKHGLFYPGSSYDHEMTNTQRWALEVLDKKFLPGVEKVLKDWKPNYVHTIFTGDMGDKDYRNRSPREYWTQSETVLAENLGELIDPIVKLSDHCRFVIGTKSHIGTDGGVDNAIARNTDNAIWDTKSKAARGEWNYKIAGVEIQARHKGVGQSAAAKTNLLNTLSKKIRDDRVEYKRPIPDVAWRGHNHWIGQSDPYLSPVVYQCPSWQLNPEYIYEWDSIGRTTEIGGWVNIYEDGEILFTKRLRYWRKDA